MKSKLLIMGVLCAVAFTANAQTEKGKSLINGAVGFSTNKNESNSTGFSPTNQKSTSFFVTPRLGYFVANNLVIGLGLGYTQNNNTSSSINVNSPNIIYYNQTSKQHTYSINPFLRKYVDIVDKFKFFGQFNVGVGFGKVDNKYEYNTQTTGTTENSSKFTSYNAAISPGFAFFPSKRWAIEFSFPLLNYNKTKPKDESTNVVLSTDESFTFATSSFNPSIGFNFHF
ncbi:porin family protein [Pedobacter polaris]|uniref:Porin family protein n=1 Tax=Pedobacter polaris TaxID=2571273 RepID=A0A4U1CT44_9SPHI|nr:outer membrane beta-barrel protein [Pedobacter polaris]TKC10736.1 porin family protein [Pedobacter polaris]